MRVFWLILITVFISIFFGTLVPGAKASEQDKKTIVTFNEPVEVPGHVLLPGTYIFSLEDTTDRSVVQIWSEDDMHLVTTVIACSTTRIGSANGAIFTFKHWNAQSPEAIKNWFYPGDLNGLEFLYPSSRSRSFSSAPQK